MDIHSFLINILVDIKIKNDHPNNISIIIQLIQND